MNDEQYFSLECLSQSRLNVVKCIRDSLELPSVSQKALDFGKQFHQAALQPEEYQKILLSDQSYKDNRHKIHEMVKALNENSLFVDLLNAPGEVEKSHFFQESRYGLE
jgi:hypothetical protein